MPSASVENTTPFTTYTFKVQAENIVGKGPMSMPVSGQFNWNKATGGIEKEFAEGTYNGEPGTWKTHTFQNPGGTFDVQVNVYDFRVLIVGGGGNGGGGGGNQHGGGGSGGYGTDQMLTLDIGPHQITVGAATKPSTAFGITMNQGANGGYMAGADTHGATNGPLSDIYGTTDDAPYKQLPFQFGYRGGGVHANWAYKAGRPHTGDGGGGGHNEGQWGGGPGGSGVVIIAYRTG